MPIINYMSSFKFTIIILVIIVIASIIGTVISQDSRNPVIKALQLDDVYHSYWYMALLGLFCLNLCLCSIKNIRSLSRIFSISPKSIEEAGLKNLSFYQKYDIHPGFIDRNMLVSLIQYNFARKLFYKQRYSNAEKGIYYFERGRLARLGPIVTHASIIIIIIGGIIVGFMEYKDYIRIPVGETMDVPNTNFEAKAEDFKIDFYPDTNRPKQYITKLTILEDGTSKLTKDVMVNHPLKYKGIKFFQSSYGVINTVGVELRKRMPDNSEGELIGEFNIEENSVVDVPNTNLKIQFLSFVPDFVMDSDGHVSSRSSELRNPAALFELFDGKQSLGKSWRFLKFPSFETTSQSDYMMEFISMYPSRYYTELQISRDTGISVIWTGSLIMIIGLFLSFYFSHKRLWIRISTEKEIITMEIGGASHKNRSGFDKENDVIAKLLQK